MRRLRRHGRSLTDESVYHKHNDDDVIKKEVVLRTHKLRRSVSGGDMICVREPAARARFQVRFNLFFSSLEHTYIFTHDRIRRNVILVREVLVSFLEDITVDLVVVLSARNVCTAE